jgi:NCS1 family nucleobase:cation symporter-1
MYLGHYFAWICAGIMGAVLGNALNPGEMADRAAGIAGLLCVLLAGWTTTNPTIYRAGLALQIITPNWPLWAITVVAGGITTIVACFPAIFMQLLGFVAIYGLMLMPIGTIIVVEHWLFPRLGLRQYWTQARNLSINMPALITWLAVIVLAFPFEDFTGNRVPSILHLAGIHLFFRWLPCWLIAAALYMVLCRIWPNTALPPFPDGKAASPLSDAGGHDLHRKNERTAGTPGIVNQAAQRSDASPTPLMWIAGGAAAFSILIMIYLAIRVFLGGSAPEVYATNLAAYKFGLIIATIIYFVSAIYWETRREKQREGT